MNGSKAEEITGILRDEILRGQYRAGERLPSERDLAARFGANRGAARESIKKLEQLGIVEVKPGGVRIVPVEDATLEVLGHLMDLGEIPSPTLVMQLFEVIGAIMPLSVTSAIEKATPEQIKQLRGIVSNLINSIEHQEEYYPGWQTLVDCFSKINRNLVLRLIFNGLKTQFVERLQNTGLHPEIDKQQDLKFLQMIDTAFADRDHQAASDAIIGHFNLLKESIVTALEQIQEKGTRSAAHV